ncbi:Methyltransferase type 12 [Chloroherpeton thalassium ATCC 35110]|uniref:Methyltransferase type 12 n=1 Tax=Chloroherpeton thalassium (strain ATCC 35110 / GB-78) TaxID=517418 RepID=B3QUS3_CHLT3|nr:class I SAM-dependent methyltransferase [Chloroherpeton thalassium]ACF14424.1 Methyltransferase type 12 [Chloroherpeton thalassium ATCC 35110]
MMEEVSCPISHSQEYERLFQVSDRFDLQNGAVWQVKKSKRSGLVLLSPRPSLDEIAAYYESADYDPFVSVESQNSFRQKVYTLLRNLISLRSKANAVLAHSGFQSGGTYRVLEIGCATGEFLLELNKQAERMDLKLFGVEVSEKAARFARDYNGLNVFHGDLLSAPYEESFDLIAMWHSLEHIHQINETLGKIKSLLQPDGVLMVAMPNVESTDAKFYRENWVAFDAPRHLYHFSPRTFGELLKKHHLEVFDMHGLMLDSLYNAFLSESLIAATKGKGAMKFLYFLRAGFIGIKAAIDSVHPGLASSVVYYIRHSNH